MNDTHQYCWQMLPWVVTGRISASDKQRIERHLQECAACRAELDQQRSLCDLVCRDQPVMLAPQASLQKLMDRIDAGFGDDDAHDDETRDVAAQSKAPSRRIPHWLAVAAAVQTIAIAALLTLVWQQQQAEMEAPRFTTLSTAQRSAQGPVLRVVFRPEMTNAELQDLLQKIDAQVVAGPTEAGVYSVALSANARIGDVAAALTHVRNDPRVIFAEQVGTEVQR